MTAEPGFPRKNRESLDGGLRAINRHLQEQVDALAAANHDLTQLLDHADIATLFLGPDRRIRCFTPAAARLFQLVAADVGRPIGEFSSCFCDADLPGDVDSALQNATAHEREINRPDERWYLRRITPCGTLDRPIEGVVVTFVEVSSVKRTEAELRRLTGELNERIAQCTRDFEAEARERRRAEKQARARQAELAHLHRLYTAGEMAAAFAHELNQPLAAIASYSDAGLLKLRRGEIDPEQLTGSLEQITAQAQRAGRIMRELLAFLSKTETFKTSVDLNSLVRSSIDLTQPEASTLGIRIRHDLAGGLRPVLAEAIHIEHVLLNLLRNSIDAIRDAGLNNGHVTIQTSAADRALAKVSVQDNGPGIDAHSVEQVFKPFHTTKPQGLGMGLAISRTIVEAHGGRIWAEPGRGGLFHFTLPFSR